jgi:hypothetical protein
LRKKDETFRFLQEWWQIPKEHADAVIGAQMCVWQSQTFPLHQPFFVFDKTRSGRASIRKLNKRNGFRLQVRLADVCEGSPLHALFGKEHAVFLEFSLCLSRACLDKMFVFIYKLLKKTLPT